MKTYADRHDDDRRKRKRPNRMIRERFEDIDEEEVMEMIDSPHENLMLMMEQFDAPPEREADESHLIAEDRHAEEEGKISKSAFLEMLEAEVRANLAESFEGTGFSEKDCPWLKHLFRHYKHRGAAHLEKSIHKYFPETRNAESVEEYVAPLQAKVQRAIAAWLKNGEITEVPDEIPRSLLQMAGQGAANQRAKMGKGKELESGTKSKMEGAFGANLGDVKVHTDSEGSAFAEELDAQAATIGKDIAFAGDKYKPGTPEGDALIAHELAHVMQQSDAMENGEMGSSADYGAMEEDAEGVTKGVMGKLFGKAKGMFGDLRMNGMARLKSGLQVQRCVKDTDKDTEIEIEPPIAEPKIVTDDELSKMTYQETEDLIVYVDKWIFAGTYYDAVELEKNIEYIKRLENHQFSLRRAGKFPLVRPVPGSTVQLEKTGISQFASLGDMWVEMTGRPFITLKPAGAIPENTHVTILYWSIVGDNAVIQSEKDNQIVVEQIAKTDLDVDIAEKDKVLTYYSSGVARGKKTKRDLVREVMYNRFDPQIKHWVDHYNDQYKLTDNKADPNVLKSMLFEETRFGTSGQHLNLPKYSTNFLSPESDTSDYRYSRYNLGQITDTVPYNQFMMMQELAPDILEKKEYRLNELDTPYFRAKHKKKEITNAIQKGGAFIKLTPEEEKLIDPQNLTEFNKNEDGEKDYFYDMNNLSTWNKNAIQKAVDEFNSRKKDGKNLNTGSIAPSENNLFEDYDYMIRTAARWWFQMFENTLFYTEKGDWVEATERYNGGPGQESRMYKKRVYSRVYTRGVDDPVKFPHKDLMTGNVLNLGVNDKNVSVYKESLDQEEKIVTCKWSVAKVLDEYAGYSDNKDMVNTIVKKHALDAVEQMKKLGLGSQLMLELGNDLFLIYTAEKAATDSAKQKILETIKIKVVQLRKEANDYVKEHNLDAIPWKTK